MRAKRRLDVKIIDYGDFSSVEITYQSNIWNEFAPDSPARPEWMIGGFFDDLMRKYNTEESNIFYSRANKVFLVSMYNPSVGRYTLSDGSIFLFVRGTNKKADGSVMKINSKFTQRIAAAIKEYNDYYSTEEECTR